MADGGREYRKRVVILGAGFAGLNAAQGLKGLPVDVTVVVDPDEPPYISSRCCTRWRWGCCLRGRSRSRYGRFCRTSRIPRC